MEHFLQISFSMLYVKRNRFVKVVLLSSILSLVMMVTSAFAPATGSVSTLEKCLDDQPNETQACLSKSVRHITLETCYDQVKTVRSNYLKENLKLYCFYHISEFPKYKACLSKAKLFSDSENHDAALFNCYSQFEEKMTKPACEQLSKQFRFPEKGRYLKNHCANLE